MMPSLRRWFDTLLGRTALILMVTLAISHFGVFGLFRLFHNADLHQQFTSQLLAAIDTQRSDYLRLSAGQRAALLENGSGGLSLRLPPGIEPRQNDMDRAINQDLTTKLGPGTWLGHSFGGPRPHDPERPPGQAPKAEPPPQPPPRLGGPGGGLEHVGGPRLWLRFPLDGKLVWFSQRFPAPERPPGGQSLVVLVVVMIVLALTATLALLWPIYRPLRRLANAHAAVGRGQTLAPLPDQGPLEVVRLTASFNRMVSDLAGLEEQRRTLLAGVSHDLRTPLTRLRMRLALLDGTDTSAYERDLDDIERITEQFLAYVRGEADDGKREPIEISGLLQDLVERYGNPAIRISGTPTPAVIQLDRLAIHRALCNLIDNALSHGQPPIELSTSYLDGCWLVSVRDHGSGLPDSELDAVRQPFHRLDPARQGHGHCGLGLAIAERVALRHGGKLVLRNADDGGLIASLQLPANR